MRRFLITYQRCNNNNDNNFTLTREKSIVTIDTCFATWIKSYRKLFNFEIVTLLMPRTSSFLLKTLFHFLYSNYSLAFATLDARFANIDRTTRLETVRRFFQPTWSEMYPKLDIRLITKFSTINDSIKYFETSLVIFLVSSWEEDREEMCFDSDTFHSSDVFMYIDTIIRNRRVSSESKIFLPPFFFFSFFLSRWLN